MDALIAVEAGQEWRLSSSSGSLFVRILSVEDGRARVQATNRRIWHMRAATLERGHRGARLVLNADGSRPAPRPQRSHARVGVRALKAHELQTVEGLSRDAIAERFMVGVSTVDRWLQAVRSAQKSSGAT